MIYDDLPIKNDDFEFAMLDYQRVSSLFGQGEVPVLKNGYIICHHYHHSSIKPHIPTFGSNYM